jgi:hypothetical protein
MGFCPKFPHRTGQQATPAANGEPGGGRRRACGLPRTAAGGLSVPLGMGFCPKFPHRTGQQATPAADGEPGGGAAGHGFRHERRRAA